jgi:glutathione S-transferase
VRARAGRGRGPDGRGEFLIGGAPSLADLHLVPILDYFARTEDGCAALARHPRLSAWWEQIEQRPSVARTRPSLG